MSEKYNIQFIEKKLGKFDKEYQYPRTSLIEGPLIYIEKETKNELEDEIGLIKQNESINPTYIWGYVTETDATYVTRTFGENKVFIYNPKSMKKTEYVKGKLKVLKSLQEDTIDDLFDQKAVFDYFYKKLWDLRLELGREIRDKNGIPDNIALMEAQHIIDRIIFTYFICEKELISVKEYGPISGKELFSDIIGQLPDPWKHLKKLFFEQFAKSEAKELDCGGDVYIETPYLNGGLFRSKKISGISEENLQIEYDWNKIFDPLNKYSWIIEDEITDREGEYEGNLTPEIIGHIYEKFVISIEDLDEINLDELKISSSGDLKRGNKKIGAYYTPEHVTDYISRNTINPIINERLGIAKEIEFQELIETSNKVTLNKILNLIDEITICDPACGSGAFLIKAGDILLEYKTEILRKLEIKDINRYKLKKDIIIKNLHGVDIQEGAVEICKLRLWLWLISSSSNRKVEPLPNIEYNFIQGNSLVGWLNEKLNQNVLIHLDETYIRPLVTLKLGYEPHQRELIDTAIANLRKTNVKNYAKSISLLKSLYSYSVGEDAEILKDAIEWTRSAIYDKINRVFLDYINSKGIKMSFDDFIQLDPLNWQVDFNDIFSNGGFDAIIGNPPYVRYHRLKKNQKHYYSNKYSFAKRQFDLFCIMLERGYDILKSNGYFGFIIPSLFLKGHQYEFHRKFLLKYINFQSIVEYGDGVFEGVQMPTCILLYEKSKKYSNLRFRKIKGHKISESKLEQKVFLEVPNAPFDPNVSMLTKIFLKSVKIGDKFNIRRGLELGKNKISHEKKSESDLPILSGNEIRPYVYESPKFIDSVTYQKFKKSNSIFSSPKVVIRETGGFLMAAYDDLDILTLRSVFNLTNADDSIHPKYLTVLMNSRLYSFIFETLFKPSTDIFPKIRISQAKELPVYLINSKDQSKFVNEADNMIHLINKAKTEKNNFKNTLKKEYGVVTFSKKMEDYHELTFSEFWKELKKQHVTNKEDLKKEFENNVSNIRPLLQKIEENRVKVNKMVYELYGLEEKEIRIIETT